MWTGDMFSLEVGSWGSKAALFSTGLIPVLERLGETDEPEDEVVRILPTIQELINVDEYHEFNRSLLHGIIFGLWIEVKKLLPQGSGFVYLFRCTLTTRSYKALVNQCGLCLQMKWCLSWIPKHQESMDKLEDLFVDRHKHGHGQDAYRKENCHISDASGKGDVEDIAMIEEISVKDGIGQCEGDQLQACGDTQENNGSSLPEWYPHVLEILGVCMSRMMPDHPCGIPSLLSGDSIQGSLSQPSPWTSAHLAVHLLTMVDLCLSEKNASFLVLENIIEQFIQVMSHLELGFEQDWVMCLVVAYERYPDVVAILSSRDALHEVCRKGMIPLLNKVIQVGVVEDGVVLTIEEEESRLLKRVAWFLPYVLLFPVIALERIIHVAISNAGQFDILYKVICRMKQLVRFIHEKDCLSGVVGALRKLVKEPRGLLDIESGSTAFADMTARIFDDKILPTVDVMQQLVTPCLAQHMTRNGAQVKTLLLAAKRTLENRSWILDDKEGILESLVDLVIVTCKILGSRPCPLSWGCPIPQFAPLDVIELCDDLLCILLDALNKIKESDMQDHWRHLLEFLKGVDWRVRMKLYIQLDDQKGFASEVTGSRDILIPEFLKEDVLLDSSDPYQWAQAFEDCYLFMTSCKPHSYELISGTISEGDFSGVSENGRVEGVHCIATAFAKTVHCCPAHLVSWCAVVSLARTLPFLTPREGAALCLNGLPAFLFNRKPPEDYKDEKWPEGLQSSRSRVSPACTVIELVCRSTYFLSAHQDVLVVDRIQVVSDMLMRLNETCLGLLEGLSQEPQALELVGGRCFSEVCGLIAAVQEHYTCDMIQPLLLLILQTLVEGCTVSPREETEHMPVTAIGVPMQTMVEWLCSLTKQLSQPMRNVLESALDRLVERKLTASSVLANEHVV